jgi:hypothetical protein
MRVIGFSKVNGGPENLDGDQVTRSDALIVFDLTQEEPDDPSMGEGEVVPRAEAGDEVVNPVPELIDGLAPWGSETLEVEHRPLDVGRVILPARALEAAEVELAKARIWHGSADGEISRLGRPPQVGRPDPRERRWSQGQTEAQSGGSAGIIERNIGPAVQPASIAPVGGPMANEPEADRHCHQGTVSQ